MRFQLFDIPRWAQWLLRLALLVLFVALIRNEIAHKQDFDALLLTFRQQLRRDGSLWGWLVVALVLVPFNWWSETQKWLPLIRKVMPISFWRAFRAVMAGVTFSLFTPNRVGEYGGRILFVPAQHRLKAVWATIVGSIAQQLVLLGCGLLGLAYFLFEYWAVEVVLVRVMLGLGVLLLSALLLAFLNLELLVPLLRKISWLHRFEGVKKSAQIIRQYRRKELWQTLRWALLRYLIYSFQYYALLRFFGIEADLWRGFACIATVFLLQTSVPLPPIIGLMARGELALKIWGVFHADPVLILAATFVLWVINLVLPASVGLVFLLSLNWSNYRRKKAIRERRELRS